LRDGGLYSGEIDCAYSSQLAAALTRYQIHKGLRVTGQLDVDTSNALGAEPSVVKQSEADSERSSEASRRSLSRERQTPTSARRSGTAAAEARETSLPTDNKTAGTVTEMQPTSAPAARAQSSAETMEPASAPPATVSDTGSSQGDISTERLRDYVGAFVHAGMEPQVGSEADFFADRVRYYDQGMIGRKQIRNDLQDYAARWSELHFWFVGNITIEPQRGSRVRVTFPLQYELRNGPMYASGKINKTLVLEPAGEDLQIVAVI
jgi:hypothetical protein